MDNTKVFGRILLRYPAGSWFQWKPHQMNANNFTRLCDRIWSGIVFYMVFAPFPRWVLSLCAWCSLDSRRSCGFVCVISLDVFALARCSFMPMGSQRSPHHSLLNVFYGARLCCGLRYKNPSEDDPNLFYKPTPSAEGAGYCTFCCLHKIVQTNDQFCLSSEASFAQEMIIWAYTRFGYLNSPWTFFHKSL